MPKVHNVIERKLNQLKGDPLFQIKRALLQEVLQDCEDPDKNGWYNVLDTKGETHRAYYHWNMNNYYTKEGVPVEVAKVLSRAFQ